MQSTQKYIPGVCNIGPAEIRMRKKVGWTGTVITILLWVILYFSHAYSWIYIILFFPAFLGATGFIQGYSHFCAGFGMRGTFNFTNAIGKGDTVSQAEYRAKDIKKARQIFIWSAVVGLVVTLIAVFVR